MIYLFITNRKLASRNLIGIGKGLQLLNGLGLRDGNGKLDIGLGVLVARLQQLAIVQFTLDKQPT